MNELRKNNSIKDFDIQYMKTIAFKLKKRNSKIMGNFLKDANNIHENHSK